MNVQNPYSAVSAFLHEEDVRKLFSGVDLRQSRNRFGGFQYKSNESVLSELCSAELYSLARKLMIFNDSNAATIIKEATYSGEIPFKFRIIECITWILVLLPIVIMFLDFVLAWTELGSLFYLYASACGVSLLVTAKLAKKEWTVHNWNGKQE